MQAKKQAKGFEVIIRKGTYLEELKKLEIPYINNKTEKIPTLEEVFDLLKPKLKKGLKINVELKNTLIPYEGMEEKVLEIVNKYGIKENIVYSSFNYKSIEKIKIKDEESDEICEKCGRRMVIKLGRFGKFLACPGFPECMPPYCFRSVTYC